MFVCMKQLVPLEKNPLSLVTLYFAVRRIGCLFSYSSSSACMLCLDLNNPITSRFDLTLVIKSSLVCFDDQLTQFSENCHGPQNRDQSMGVCDPGWVEHHIEFGSEA